MNNNFPANEISAQTPSGALGRRGESSTATAPAADGSEEQALIALQQPDITASELAALARTPSILKRRKVVLALATHPRTPRHSSIPLLRRMFTFDLMQVSLTPAVPADLKRLSEEQILVRLGGLSTGEKISLARRASGRVAAGLLQDPDSRTVAAALNNSRLTEVLLSAALANDNTPQALFDLASSHAKWSQRRDVQIALLRSEKTPLDKIQRFASNFSADFLRKILPESRRSALRECPMGSDDPGAGPAG